MRPLGNVLTFIGFALAVPGMIVAAIGQMLADAVEERELSARYGGGDNV